MSNLETPTQIPYQAYKSKRHSRNISNPQFVPNVSPPPISRPLSVVGAPQHQQHYGSWEKETAFAVPNGSPLSKSRPPSPIILNSPPVSNGLLTPPESTDSREAPPSPVPSSNGSSITIQTPQAAIPSIFPIMNGDVDFPRAGTTVVSFTVPPVGIPKDSASAPASASGSLSASPSGSTLPTSSDSKTSGLLKSPTRKASTFRHVPLRNSRSPLPSSPLRSGSATHSRSTSVSSSLMLSDHTQSHSHQEESSDTRTRITSFSSTNARVSGNEKRLPTIPSAGDLFLSVSSASASTKKPAPSSREANRRHSASTATLGITPQPTSSFHHTTVSHVPSPSLTPSTSTSTSHTPITSAPSSRPASTPPVPPPQQYRRTSAPYLQGFQPKGIYRPCTDEFIELRRAKRDGGNGAQRIERTKLERRLEKLIALHFPPPDSERGKEKEGESHKEGLVGRRRPGLGAGDRGSRRASSFFDFDLKDLRRMSIGVDAGGLWRGVLGQGEKEDIRAAEQRITPWQEDAAVSKCPLCSTSFHPITNRKHHCRICGKIICSLPVKHPQRPVTCSLLFVVDSKTRKIEEVGEGVDYGVRKRRGGDSAARITAQDGKSWIQQEQEQEEKFLKGVRICRQCRPVLLRQQYQQDAMHVPALVKLYEIFITLEKEIEDSLPQFQELVLSLSHNDQPTKEASAARKRLLEGFAQYDSLAKQIQKLPCANGPNSSEHRVQMAIMNRANLFLQKHMFPLQSLPKPSKKSTSTSTPAGKVVDSPLIDPDSAAAHALQPLLEQEALLESFIEEAKAHRKFEDAKTLKANLKEIQGEIEKILVNAEDRVHGGEPRTGRGGKKPVVAR